MYPVLFYKNKHRTVNKLSMVLLFFLKLSKKNTPDVRSGIKIKKLSPRSDKISTENFKKRMHTSVGRKTSQEYSHVIMISGWPIFTGVD